MTVQHNTSLKPFNTFGIDVSAKSYLDVRSLGDLNSALTEYKDEDVFVLGGGSNMLLRSDIDKPVLHLNLKGIETLKNENGKVLVKAMAGENWHDFVLWCIDHNYGGLENLSLIPGNVGTAPIQNIGAYGVELKDHFFSCEVCDIKTQEFATFYLKDCNFNYRESVFKNQEKGKYIITSVVFELTTNEHEIKTDYGAIKNQLEAENITSPTIRDVSNAVIAIRKSKLPDPKEIGNSGSFFKNPVISQEHYLELQEQFPKIPGYKVSDSEIKVPAGWLIETSGFKGKRFNNYGVHEHQALVLVNYGGADGDEIYNLAVLIQKTVSRLFDINLIIEVNVI